MRRPLRLIILGDHEEESLLAIHGLHDSNFEPTPVSIDSIAALQVVLASQDWDIVLINICDKTLPTGEAIMIIRTLKPDVPVIAYSGDMETDAAVILMRSGASDYIRLADLARLPLAVERELREASMVRERLTMEEALAESENRYRSLFENMHSGVAVYKKVDGEQDFVIADINSRASEIERLSREDAIGRRVTEVFPGVYDFGILNLFLKVWETGDSEYLPATLYHDSRLQDSWRENWIYKLPGGEVVAIYNDVTAYKKAEAELRRDEERMQSLLDIFECQTRDIRALLKIALETSLKLTGSKLGFIVDYDEDSELFTLQVWSLEAMHECQIWDKPLFYELESTGFWGESVRQRRPIIENDFRAPNPYKKGFPRGHVEFDNFMAVPIWSENRIVAVVGTANKPEDYEERDVKQISLLMDYVWKVIQRLQAEAALEKSEERFRRLFETMTEGVMYQDAADGRITMVNPAAERILGIDQRSIKGRTSLDSVWRTIQEDGLPMPADRHPFVKAVKTGQATKREVMGVYNPALQEHRWLAISCVPVLTDGSGEAGHVYSTFIDITEQKRAEEALHEREHQLYTIMNQAPFGMLILNRSAEGDLYLDACNLAASEILGADCRPFLGKMVDDSWFLLGNQVVHECCNQILAAGPYSCRQQIVFADGNRKRQLDVTVFPSVPGQVCLVFRDLTDQDPPIISSDCERQDLERQLQERTAELQSYLYTVSHDFKAPLRCVQGYASVLLEDYFDSLDEEAKSYLVRIGDAARDMAGLMEGLLQLSRVSLHPLNIGECDLSHLAEKAIAELMTNSPERRCACEIQPGIVVKADSRLMDIVIRNIITNAWNYSASNPKSRIEMGWVADSEERIVYIRDNGVGFNMKKAGRLFQVFHRMHPDLDCSGRGIGLSMARLIIGKHGGEIWAESEEGKGATFYFRL